MTAATDVASLRQSYETPRGRLQCADRPADTWPCSRPCCADGDNVRRQRFGKVGERLWQVGALRPRRGNVACAQVDRVVDTREVDVVSRTEPNGLGRSDSQEDANHALLAIRIQREDSWLASAIRLTVTEPLFKVPIGRGLCKHPGQPYFVLRFGGSQRNPVLRYEVVNCTRLRHLQRR